MMPGIMNRQSPQQDQELFPPIIANTPFSVSHYSNRIDSITIDGME